MDAIWTDQRRGSDILLAHAVGAKLAAELNQLDAWYCDGSISY
jgi:hypothetical protein